MRGMGSGLFCGLGGGVVAGMVEIKDIVDRKSLEAWLKGQPREVSVWVVQRSSMRALPSWWTRRLSLGFAQKNDVSVLPTLWSGLILMVSRKMLPSEIKETAVAAGTTILAVNTAAEAAEAAVRAIMRTVDDLDHFKLWREEGNPLLGIWAGVKQQLVISSAYDPNETERVKGDWSFWIKWYDSVLAGEPLNWDMLEEIALIEPAEWEKGAVRVNFLIGEIEKRYGNETNTPKEFQPASVSPAAKNAIVKRVQQNRDTIALSVARVLEQISEFRERMRGVNDMDPVYRESIFDYLDGLSEQLSELLGQLPDDGQVIEEPQADKLVIWGQKYRY